MSHPRQSFRVENPPPVESNFEIESGLFSTSSGDTTHAIFAPLHYEPGYGYPLVIWLHGPGSDERQLLRIMPLVSMRNYVAVAPRGVPIDDGSPQGAGDSDVQGGRRLLDDRSVRADIIGWSPADESILQAEQRIFDCMELTKRRFNIAPRRVFLAGFDTGGTMAMRVAMNHPYLFSGVLSLGGAFPSGRAPLSRLPEARQLPVFLAAGRRSTIYGENEVCTDLRLLHTAGLSITVRLYPCGHEMSPQMLSDLDRWIIEQITSASARVPADAD